MKWLLIFKNEIRSYFKSDKALFIAHLIIIFSFGSLYSSHFKNLHSNMGLIWLVSFSVIVTSNFSYSTFVSERMNGMLEILLVSGIKRKDILLGKVIHVILFSSIMGLLIYMVSILMNFIMGQREMDIFRSVIVAFPVYLSSCVFNVSISAWFSVKLPNPRILSFVNLFIIVIISTVNFIIGELFNISGNSIIVILLFGAAVFYKLALNEYRSENVTKPLIF